MNPPTAAHPPLWISSAPLRLSLAGGGTDLPSYAGRFGGAVLGTSTNLRVSVVGRAGGAGSVLRACLDTCATGDSAEALSNPLARAALQWHWNNRPLHFASFGDVPGGTGMGSSAAFCTALIGGLTGAGSGHAGALQGVELAEAAAAIEMQALNRPVGKQDHYLCALGGFQELNFSTDGTVEAEPITVDPAVIRRLDKELLLFFTGITRDAGTVLAAQGNRAAAGHRETEGRLHEIKELVAVARKALSSAETWRLGEVLGRHWEIKRKLSSRVSLPEIDRAYRDAIEAGATGGKVIGAGGGGFLLLHVPTDAQTDVRTAISTHEMAEQPFLLDDRGHEFTYIEDRRC